MLASSAPTAVPVRTAEEVVAWFREGGPPLVALSGGVDSSVAASLAFEAWPERAVAVSLTGPAVAARETSRARAVAEAIGIELVTLPVDPVGVEEYRANSPDRCYFCRSTESRVLRAWGEPRGIVRYVDGVHLDDLGEDRPGLRAMAEAGFEHPLLWAGWRKTDVRALARRRGLPNWDEPSDACLASRVRHGQPITTQLLGRVERAESLVHALGFRRVRVRVEGAAARVEVDRSDVERLRSPEVASRITAELGALGFDAVLLDPHGYRARAGA